MESTNAAEEYWAARDRDPGAHPSYFTLTAFASARMPDCDRLRAHIRECAACRRVVEEKALGAPRGGKSRER